MPSGTYNTLVQGQETARNRSLHAGLHDGIIRDIQFGFVHQSTGVEQREVSVADSSGEEGCFEHGPSHLRNSPFRLRPQTHDSWNRPKSLSRDMNARVAPVLVHLEDQQSADIDNYIKQEL